jgi:hypothetical protein
MMEQRVRGSEEAAAILAVEEARPGERLWRPLADALLPRPAVLLPMTLERRGTAKRSVAVGALDMAPEVRANVGEGI